MADNRNINTGGGGSRTFLAFLLGAVVLAIALFGYFLFVDDRQDVAIDAPAVTTTEPVQPAEPAPPAAAPPAPAPTETEPAPEATPEPPPAGTAQ